ncbi:RNA degradosome polyphosphate kinase [Levilactobacillus bambusae]|uniref:RNA degradosome polyphosphate kinase n=1 Tax=Levilactobacillus bambusae TaxID=2024736 RepID=UPI0021E7EDDC|nr:RNA degradosome polyphosphate kinase [Levilactobacillus bambusae]
MDFHNPDYYTNRELSWFDFNFRCLEEARDKNNPLLERLRFLGITQSNVDEFFSVRVASVAKLVDVNYDKPDAAGMTPREQLIAIHEKAHQQVSQQYSTLKRSLLPLLADINVHLLRPEDLTPKQTEYIEKYFNDELYPALTPMAVDTSRPFPFIGSNTLNIALRVNKRGHTTEQQFATLQVPDVFSRVVSLPDAENDFILLDDIIKQYIGRLFINYDVQEAATYRVLRDMDLDVADEDTSDLLKEVQQQLKQREHGPVMRLEVAKKMSKKLRHKLAESLDVPEFAVYDIPGPIDLTFCNEMAKKVTGHDDLNYPPFKSYQNPALDSHHNIFDTIRQRDYIMQHPYDSFNPVTELIHQAAIDPDVLAIKMTLYRVSGNSPIIKDLGTAAENGKQVTVLLEVKARFDEEHNVHWARTLEKKGCHVIYGLMGLKTHCKLALVVRREEDGIRRYMHMGTGNYNDVTARFYTDLSLLTANTEMGIDASNIFNMLSGFSEPPYFHLLHISPNGIRDFLTEKIHNEIKNAKAGLSAHIWMKMNSLSDADMIAELYEASAAGVKVDLLVRGICCLNVGIKGVSENITVHSIVGRFLEHSRIYCFENQGDEQVYLSSADLMTRNLNRRVELLFPVMQPDTRERVITIFKTLWADNVKTRCLLPDGVYKHVGHRGTEPHNAQREFIRGAEIKVMADQEARAKDLEASSHQFQPLMSPHNQPEPFSDENKED